MAQDESQDLVVVTGASGFIASHCVEQLLQHGYRVRGTLRDLQKAQAVRAGLHLDEEQTSRLSFCAAELTSDAGWDDALAGADYLLHTASPVPREPPKDRDALLGPALEGTQRVLAAAARARVKRVVLTSSIASIMMGKGRGPGQIFSEKDWSNPEGDIDAYSRSKTLAERAAWDFVASLPKPERFELAVINPGFVLGPSLVGTNNTSNEVVRKLLDREVPGSPRMFFSIVDVRDVAEAHIVAMTHPAAAGERFLVSAHQVWFGEIAKRLAEAGYRVPTLVVPNWVVRLVALFDPIARYIVPDLGWEYQFVVDKAKGVLGFSPRDLQSTILDTAASIVSRRSS